MAIPPPVTVVMPARNTEDYIAPAITSILNQTFEDFELWVLENGSTDRTAEIAEGFSDPRVKVFRLGSVGFQGALSYALHNAKSDWIARMDSDDISLPNRLEMQVAAVRQRPAYVLIGTAYAILTPSGHVIERRKDVESRELDKVSVALGGYRIDRPRGRLCADASMLFNRQVALQVGGYDSSFTMGDVPLWLRMLQDYKGWEIAEPLYLYRLRPSSFSDSHDEGIEVRAKYTPEILDDFLSLFPKKVQRQQSKNNVELKFWRHIGFLELLAGDRKAILDSADKVASAGGFRSACGLRVQGHVGKLSSLYYRKKWASFYQHRADLENRIRNLL